jgi:hypothetical protein
MKTIKYSSNEEMWKLESELKANGYKKTSDCYWYQHYTNGENEITLERE